MIYKADESGTMRTDSSLEFRRRLARARAGDEEARNQLIVEAWDRAKGRAARYGGRQPERVEAAIDLVGAVVGKVAAKLGQFHGDTRRAFRAWVATIFQRELVSSVRRRPRPFLPLDPTLMEEAIDSTAGLSTKIERRTEQDQVRKLVAGLPTKLRSVVQLRYTEGLSFAEIGEALGCSEDAARMRHMRALKRLGDQVAWSPVASEP